MTVEPTASPVSSRAHRPPERSELPGEGARIHMMGIGGAGMRGLAVLLAAEGYRVSGCDRSGKPSAPELEERGVELAGGHGADHVAGAALLIRSSAVPEEHPEVEEARRLEIPVMKRARALGALVNGTRLTAVSGTHGKTTITAMTAHALRGSGREPAVAVGGMAPGIGGYGAAGAGELAVVEADEFDRSFLELDPDLLVVSSLEAEHVDTYGGLASAREAYRALARRAGPRLGVLVCADDEGARSLGEEVGGSVSYGRSVGAAYRLVEGGAAGGEHRLETPEGTVRFTLPLAGRHNRLNAAAALAAVLRLGVAPEELEGALAGFRGVERRLELLHRDDDLAVVDDYAHHPTEVTASLEALRERYPERRLVVVFQPHLYSRTREFTPEFASALARADRALVLPIYPSREDPIPGVTSQGIVEAAPPEAEGRIRAATPEEVADPDRFPADRDRPTVVVFMGAGDVTEMARALVRRLGAS